MATSCRRWNGGNTAALRTTVSVLTTRDVTERPRRMNSPYFPPPVVNLCRSSVAVPLRHPQGQRPDGDQSDTMAGGKWRPSWRLFNSTPSAPRRLRPRSLRFCRPWRAAAVTRAAKVARGAQAGDQMHLLTRRHGGQLHLTARITYRHSLGPGPLSSTNKLGKEKGSGHAGV
jgi:hypothetical protein